MVKAREREEVIVEVEADSELAKALAAVGTRPVTMVSNGVRYEVHRAADDRGADYDPEAFRAALRRAASIFTPEEAEQLEKDIYRWREEGSRPFNRP